MFKKKLLSASVALVVALSATQVLAQDDAVEEIVVSGIRESLAKALDVKKEKMQIVDAIVAEDIGKFPDNNVVEALQRVTGVQVTNRGSGEVSGISIRGLPDITTTVNGRNIFTAAGTAVALQDIPASLIRQVDVYKTRSASQIESGIAGAIDVKTQRPFDFADSKAIIAARGIYGEQSGNTDPAVSALLSDRWETGLGEFGALINVSMTEIDYRNQGLTAGAMVPFMTSAGGGPFGPFERVWPNHGAVSENPIWTPGLLDGLPSTAGSTFKVNGVNTPYILGRDAVFQNDENGHRERPAANVSFQYAPDDKSEYLFEAFYNGYRNENYNDLLFSFADWWGSYGGMTPANAQAAANVVLHPGTNIIKSRSTTYPWVFTSGDLSTGQTDSYLYALGGKWELSDKLTVKSELNYQTSTYEGSFFAMRFIRPGNTYKINVDFNSGGGIPAFNFVDDVATTAVNEGNMADPSAYLIDGMYDNANKDSGDATTFTTDFTYDADFGIFTKFEGGVRLDQRTATTAFSRQDRCCGGGLNVSTIPGLAHVNSGFFDGRADVPQSWAAADGYYLRDNADKMRTLYGLTKRNVRKSFDIESLTTSAYGQAQFETEVAGNKLDGEIGVRYTGVDTDSTFFSETPYGVPQVTTKGNTKTSEVLPSLMLRYHFSDELQARLAMTKTLRYPGFGDLNPLITYNEDVTGIGYGTAGGGNPDLKPTTSTNYDLSLEWYFGESSSLYGTLFQRDIEDLVIGFRRSVTHAKSTTNSTPYKFILSQPYNASSGTLSGAELGLVWFPENLPAALDGFGIQASYTLLNSEQSTPLTSDAGDITGYKTTDMFGVSDSSYSVVLAYDKDKIGMRLSYAWRSAFLANYEAPLFANPLEMWRKPEASMDLQLSYKVLDNLELTLDGTNLTNELYQSYYGSNSTTANFGTAIYSRTFAIGARYSF